MVYKNVRIKLKVQQLQQNNADCKSLVFERPAHFNYEAGDWIDVDFADTSYKGGKTYSLSSSPTENELVISFRQGISPFKKMLQAIQPGDEMLINQYGNDYGFHLRDNRSSVLIAGGIGIAPFRSMLKEMFDLRANNDVQLVYLNKDDDFIFKAELEDWGRCLPNFKIEYVVTKEFNRKNREQLLKTVIKDTAQNYFIAGPSGMVTSTAGLLETIGVAAKDIRIDNFGLY